MLRSVKLLKINSLKSIDLSRFKRYTFAITINGENMQEDFILDNEIEEEDYICYHPTEDKEVFGNLLDKDEYEIYISKECNLNEISSKLTEYMNWFSLCKDEVVEYLKNNSGEEQPEEWFSTIEVYNIEIIFNSPDDFSAIVTLGKSIDENCIIEVDFEKFQITDSSLNN